jgi:hypothetical protein
MDPQQFGATYAGEALAKLRERKILFCLDAIQTLGAFPNPSFAGRSVTLRFTLARPPKSSLPIRRLRWRLCMSLLPLLAFTSSSVWGATLPSGFRETLVASGLANPTAMQFAPDGRLFVCEQGGQLRVIKDGETLAIYFLPKGDPLEKPAGADDALKSISDLGGQSAIPTTVTSAPTAPAPSTSSGNSSTPSSSPASSSTTPKP